MFFASFHCSRYLFLSSPRGLTFLWWGCHGLCHRRKLTKLAHCFLFCSCVCFCLYVLFNSISFHKFSRQLLAFSLCSSGLNSALLVLLTMSLFINVSLSPDLILLWLTGLKAPSNQNRGGLSLEIPVYQEMPRFALTITDQYCC